MGKKELSIKNLFSAIAAIKERRMDQKMATDVREL